MKSVIKLLEQGSHVIHSVYVSGNQSRITAKPRFFNPGAKFVSKWYTNAYLKRMLPNTCEHHGIY